MPDATQLLVRWGKGDEDALAELLPLLYSELKSIARARMRGEQEGHTLNTTGLVHEAYLRLVEIDKVDWHDRNHFLAVAARTMRRVLIDHARKRGALKRGQGASAKATRLVLESDRTIDLIALDNGLANLAEEHPRQSRSLELRYFGGLSQQEIAAILSVSQPTVARDLGFARAWLASHLSDR